MSNNQPFEIQKKTKTIVKYNGIIYCINEAKNEAILIGYDKTLKKITIPRSITKGSKEYEITTISDKAFSDSKLKIVDISSDSKLQIIGKHAFTNSTIKSITIPSSVTLIGEGAFYFCEKLKEIVIPNDSKLRTIDKYAFSYTNITSITIPSELIELKEGWCSNTSKLKKITVSPNNPRYCCFNEKMIIGKTNINQDNYDCLVFCARDIKHIQIPNFIEHIGSYSISCCNQLETIEFSSDSKLKTINEDAFFSSSIKSIKIPQSVTVIKKGAFAFCDQLEQLEIASDSKIEIFDEEVFYDTRIKSITFPSELTELRERWCAETPALTKIAVSPMNPRFCSYEDKMILGKTIFNQEYYDCIILCVRDIKRIQIPNFIENICSHSFSNCNQLETIEFSSDSKLQAIDECAFASSSIKSIKIPKSVTMIGLGAFADCKLEKIMIPNDSQLEIIQNVAFSNSIFRSIKIPPLVNSIGPNAFNELLLIIEISNPKMIPTYHDFLINCQNALLMIPIE